MGNPMPRRPELSGNLTRANRQQSQEAFCPKPGEAPRNDSLRRQLAAQRMAIREEERTTIAREIHDELGQMLAALQLNVSLITLEYHDHAQLVTRTLEMEQLIGLSIMTVQRIATELRPVMLDQLGLAAALEWQLQEFRKRSKLACKLNIRLAEQPLTRDVTTAIYRIFQEALTNVIRHSGATRVEVNLSEKSGWLVLSVRDNGRGITKAEQQNLLSLGLAGMRERAEAFGGKLRISGASQQGTALFLRIPSAGKEDRHARQDTCCR